MNWTIITATILVTAELVNPLSAAGIVTHLPAELRLSLQQPGVFQMRANVSAIPDAVASAFAKAAREERFAMAEPGASWQANDVLVQPALPWRRLARVALSRSFCLIFYERGGRGHSYHVAAFHLRILRERYLS